MPYDSHNHAARPAEPGAGTAVPLRAAVAAWQGASPARSLGQAATSFLPFLALCAMMYASVGLALPYWETLLLALPAAGFVVRIFIIQHDCGHGAFFRSRRANEMMGRLCSLFTMTPFANWRRQHAGHHAHWNNLDRRDAGIDMYSSCLTLDEYRAMGRFARLRYRLLCHPVIALLVLPPVIFLLLYRLPFDTPKAWRRERLSVHLTNLSLLLLVLGLGFTLGFRAVLLVQLPVMAVAAIIGVWLFSVQHRFEGTVWLRQSDWNARTASLEGSSYLKLPRLLQWFTGNIGFHHVHHLNPHVPNYRLQACHEAVPALRAMPGLGLRASLRGCRLALWDEARGRMVRFPARI